MLKKVLPYIFTAVMMVLMIGCVSKQDYDAVVKERDDLKMQVSLLQTYLDKYTALKSDVTAIQTRLAKEMKMLMIYIEYLTAVTKFDASVAYISTGARTDAMATIDPVALARGSAKFVSDFDSAVDELDNPDISYLWNECRHYSTFMDTNTAGDKMSSLIDLLIKLINDDTKALETALR